MKCPRCGSEEYDSLECYTCFYQHKIELSTAEKLLWLVENCVTFQSYKTIKGSVFINLDYKNLATMSFENINEAYDWAKENK